VLDVVYFQVDEDEAAKDAVVEDEIDSVMGVVEGNTVLPPDKGEAFSQLQKKRLKVIAEKGFEIGLSDCMRFGDFEKLKNEGVA